LLHTQGLHSTVREGDAEATHLPSARIAPSLTPSPPPPQDSHGQPIASEPYSLVPGLVALYPFEGSPANLAEPSGAALDGVAGAGASPLAAGRSGGGFYFTGAPSASVAAPVGLSPALRPRVTIGAWVQLQSAPSTPLAPVVCHDNGGHDRCVGVVEGAWSAHTGSTSPGVLKGSAAAVGEWAFVAAVYDAPARSLLLYVDGALSTSVATPGNGAPGLSVGGAGVRAAV